MNLIKSIVAFCVLTLLCSSCKDTANKPAIGNKETKAGKQVAVVAKPETASFKIAGMTCAIGCAKTIETKLSKMDGVQRATVDFDKKLATVAFDGAVQTPEKLTKAVESTGDGETYKVSEMKIKG
jgi:mercuric ion binding protein